MKTFFILGSLLLTACGVEESKDDGRVSRTEETTTNLREGAHERIGRELASPLESKRSKIDKGDTSNHSTLQTLQRALVNWCVLWMATLNND